MDLFKNILCIILLASFSCAVHAMEKKHQLEEEKAEEYWRLFSDDSLNQTSEKNARDEFLQETLAGATDYQLPAKYQKINETNTSIDDLNLEENNTPIDNQATTNALTPEPSYVDLQEQLTQTRNQVTQLNAIVASYETKIAQLERIINLLAPSFLPKPPSQPIYMQMAPKPAPQAKKIIIHGPPSLLQAAFDGNLDLTRKLLQTGANVNEKNTDKIAATPLHCAIVNKKPNLEVIKLLIKNGAAINAQTTAGATPLMAAIKSGNIEIVKILLNKKPDLTLAFVKNVKKFTALDVARLYASLTHPEIYEPIVKLLEQSTVSQKDENK